MGDWKPDLVADTSGHLRVSGWAARYIIKEAAADLLEEQSSCRTLRLIREKQGPTAPVYFGKDGIHF